MTGANFGETETSWTKKGDHETCLRQSSATLRLEKLSYIE